MGALPVSIGYNGSCTNKYIDIYRLSMDGIPVSRGRQCGAVSVKRGRQLGALAVSRDGRCTDK